MIQGILLKNKDILIVSDITKVVPDDYTDPDLEITSPYVVKRTNSNSIYIEPFLNLITEQTNFSLRSEDIFTLFTPTDNLIEEHKRATKVQEQLEFDMEVGEKLEENT